MGRAGKWLRSFLTGKKEKDGREKGEDNSKPAPVAVAVAAAATPPAPKEKKRWSFRRSVGRGGSRELNSPEPTAANGPAVVLQHAGQDSEMEQKRHAMAMAAAAAGAAVAAAQAAAAVIRLTASSAPGRSSAAIEEAAAVKIQSTFRAYLARKALQALKGLVKLQALVRGHLVRKQATATLRCMQALVTAQARARAQRMTRTADQVDPPVATPLQLQRQSTHRRSPPPDPRFYRQPPPYEHEMERNLEEVVDIKIVEMDLGAESKGSCCTKSRNSYSIPPQAERSDHRRLSSASYYGGAAPRPHSTPELHLHHHQHPPSPSPSAALTDMSPRACSGRFEEFSFPTAAAKPPLAPMSGDGDGDCPLFPNYMANTESSRAKARSQSAPKQRPVDVTCERQPSRRRSSMEGGGRPGVHLLPRGVRMQRSSSHVGSATNGCHDQCYYPWSLKLDRSSVSLKDSECGSTSTALTANTNNYCKSLFSYEIYGARC